MPNSRLYLFSSVLFYLLFFRASLDPILNLTKIGGIGLGALLNLLLVLLFIRVCLKQRFIIPKSFIKVWGCFILVGLISVINSPEKISSLRSFFSILTYWSAFCLSYFFVKNKEDVEHYIKFCIYSSIVPLIFALFEIIFPESSINRNGFRLFGSFSHPNIFAFYLILIGTLCLYSIKSDAFEFSHSFLSHAKLIFLLCVVFLILTKTRSAWLAMAVVLFIYGLFSERKHLGYLVILVFISLLIPSVHDRVTDIFSGPSFDELDIGESLNSFEWRKLVWLASWEYIISKPFLGHGYDTFSYYFLDFFPLQENTKYDAHNAYVQISFDMGFLGLISYMLIFSLILARLISLFRIDKKGAPLIFGLILSYIITSFSDNILFYLSYNWYFWSVMGLFYFYSINIAEGHVE
ncbi:O-antigen ligase family protein [Vibrio alfacsensis]|uniref:O-antigen ligase family protein n=1 Tax=Vibrio alfacsensis TaxID=1074311 RepID=UPI004067E9AA